MKKVVPAFLLLCCVLLLVWSAAFFWRNLRGVGPSLKSPSADIVRHMEKSGTDTPGIPLKLQPGFSISVFAKGLTGPRVLIFDPSDTLLVSIPSEGKVVALPDRD